MDLTPVRRVACALVVPLLLSACSLLPGERNATPPPAPASATSGGTITVGVTPPGGIDPVNAYEPVGKLISSTMCDTVVTLDPDTGQVREGLARSVVFSPDGSTLTFKMRRGLRFNDGSKLGPKDVDFSLRLLYARSTASYVRDLVLPFAAGISGSQGGKVKETSVLVDDIGSSSNRQPIAQALNEADFQMFADRGNGGAIRSLAEPAMAPISEAAYRRSPKDFAQSPVCVGPYRLEKPYQPGDASLTLVRSPAYYAQNVGYTGGGKGYFDRIVFRIYKTPELAYAGFARGEVDVVGVPPSQAASAAASRDVVRGNQTAVDYLGVPTSLDPWSNSSFRRALSLALDRTALARSIGASSAPATGFLPSALSLRAGANGIRSGAVQTTSAKATTFAGCGSSTPHTPDIAGARAALAQAKQDVAVREGLGQPLTLYVNEDGTYATMAKLAAAQWKSALGINVTVTPLRWADYLQKASQGPGFDGAFHLGWSTDATSPVVMYSDAQVFLKPLFTSTGSSNWGHWESTDFDFSFTEDAARSTNVNDRGVFFGRLEQQLCKAMPSIPIAFSSPLYLVRKSRIASARHSFLAQSTAMPVLREMYLR